VLCERVEGEDAGKVTATDIVDGVAIEGGSQLDLDLMIALVRGDWQGAIRLHVVAYDPEGAAISAMDVEGDPPSIPYALSRIIVPIELVPGAPGVYWFDLTIEDRIITRVPLRVDWS
jgi:hypothetical protein